MGKYWRYFDIRSVILCLMLAAGLIFLGASSERQMKRLTVIDYASLKGSVIVNDSGLVLDSIARKWYESDIPVAALAHGPSVPSVNEMGTTEFALPEWSGTSMNAVYGTKLIPPDARLNDSIRVYLRYAVEETDTAHFFYRLKYRTETDDVILMEYDTLTIVESADRTPYKFYSLYIGSIYYTVPKTTVVFKLSREPAEDADTYTHKVYTSIFSLKFKRDKLGLTN